MLTAFGGIFIFANKLLTELFKNLIFTFGNDKFVKTGGGTFLKSRGDVNATLILEKEWGIKTTQNILEDGVLQKARFAHLS